MQLRTVSAQQGTLWVRQGIRAVLSQPLGFATLIATFMFGVLVLIRLPWIGAPLMLVALPIASLGFMLATKLALEGGFPTPRLFFEPLRGGGPRVKSLLALGASHAVATLALVWLADVVDAGTLDATMQALPAAMQSGPDAVSDKLSAPGLAGGILLRLLLGGLLSVPFWHAPALIYWDGQGCAQSMFSSVVACWRNRGAFIVYTLVWFGLAFSFCLVFAAIGSPALIAVAGMLMWLLFPTVFYASRYFTFADCFVTDQPPLLAEPA